MTFDLKRKISALIGGYADMVEERILAGWKPFLMSFTFKPLPGGRIAVGKQMLDEIERIYNTFLTRVVRNPSREALHSRFAREFGLGALNDNRPLLIACLDGFCMKNNKKKGALVEFNGGLHAHGVLAVPSITRLKTNVPDHFSAYQNLYVKNRLVHLDIQPMTHHIAETVDYGLKGLKTGAASLDEVLVLPRAFGEGGSS
jgi:hypothetical protein